MSSLHSLIETHGADAARALVQPGEAALVSIAQEVMSDDCMSAGFSFSGFCIMALPHKKLSSNEEVWVRKGHKLTMHVAPGHMELDANNRPIMLGVPYGSRARLLLIYLTTQALKTNSREVELSGSLRSWMDEHNISTGGQSYRDISEQSRRLSACKILFLYGENSGGRRVADGLAKADLIDRGLFITDNGDPRQGTLWRDKVVLSQTFFNAIREHPVPLRMSALRAIASKSAVIDIYLWLAYRLHSLQGPTPISFQALRDQFGAGYSDDPASLQPFRRKFLEQFAAATAAYPEAKFEVGRGHITLHPSPPPVPETSADRRFLRLISP